MKKLFIVMMTLAALMLTAACGKSEQTPAEPSTSPAEATVAATPEPTAEPTPEAVGVPIVIYNPNDNADGFDLSQSNIQELTADEVMGALIDAGIFPEDVKVNSFEQTDGADVLTIDMNEAFMTAFFGTGTAGEYMLMGSFVNTFLDAFGAQSINLTVDGGYLETGHSIYDFSLTHME